MLTPIRTNYRGYDVYECPPNGQGVAALMILNVLGGFDLGPDLPLADRIHLHAEATKLAYHHRDCLIGDPAHLQYPVETLLSAETTAALRKRVSREIAPARHALDRTGAQGHDLSLRGRPRRQRGFLHQLDLQPVRLDAARPRDGCALLHNRGASFRLIEGHPNAIGPRKRPMHTIIPGMLCKDGEIVALFGVMGGHYQAAGHAAFLSGVLDQGLDVQSAIDAPRSFSFNGVLDVEPTIEAEVQARLAALGHNVSVADSPIGGAQAIWIDRANGILAAGSDPRKDGLALGF